MRTDGYEYINSNNNYELKAVDVKRPLTVSDKDSDWIQVVVDIHQYLDRNGLPNGFAERNIGVYFAEHPKKLVDGAVNLINFIIKNKADGNPIKTVVFLDKAARLAAHFFRVLWVR